MDSVLHGRDAPLAALRAALAGALAGRGQLALVSGEAGIGKSAIAAAIAREAEARGAVVTWGRAWEFADAPPYFPVWPCLRSLGIDAAHDPRQQSDEGQAFHLWETVAVSLNRVSSITPAVWILEDLHAADAGTLDLLTFLAQPLRAMRVLIVATLRAKDPRLTDRMIQRLTRIARDGLDVSLLPLTEHEIAALTEETLGRAVPKSALSRLADLTGGNPLFVVECARAFRAAGGLEGTLRSLPPTVRQVVLDRVGLLPETTRHALACGAVLGREFSAASVARMDGSLPARVIDTLLPALRSGLIDETRPGHFIFSHTLVRDAIDDALGAEERAAIHARAEVSLTTSGDTADVLVERARHALAALPSTDPAHALAVANRATDLLEREQAFDRAFDLHVRIGDAQRAGLLPPAPPSAKLRVAEIARAAGRSEARRRLCEDVVASARAAGDVELFARAALLHATDVRPGVVDRAQVALLEEARTALGDASSELGCRVLARLATALQPAPDPAVPMAMAHEALRRARLTGNDAVILEVLDVASWGIYGAPLAERNAWSNERLERALHANDLPKALNAHEWLAFGHIEAGDFDAFQRETERMLALSDEIGHPRYRWRALLIASARATALGHFAESDRYVTEVAELATLTDDPALPMSLVLHDIMRKRAQRRDDELGAAMARFGEVIGPFWHADLMGALTRATCAARREDVEATRVELVSIGGAVSAFVHSPTSALLGEAIAVAGTDDERRRIRAILVNEGASEISGAQMSFLYEGTLSRLLGLLDAALGDLVGAERHLREAYDVAVERKHAPWVAQIAHELANVVWCAGRTDEARALNDESRRIARHLGMRGLEASASPNDAAATIASEPTRVQRSEAAVAFTREGDVWAVAKGPVVVRVRDSRGVQLLARLVERPGEEIQVLALASDEAVRAPESDAGELLDDRAMKAYRARLTDIEDDISEAERHADAGRAAKLRREKDALVDELSRATGLGGRARRAGSATERARVNVQRRVKDAIARIAELDAELGRFFEDAVHTGTYCCFRP